MRRLRQVLAGSAALGAALLLGAWSPPQNESSVADAAMRGDTARVRTLLKQGADVNAAQGDGMTALHWAATRGDAAQIAMLTYAGARLEASTRNGNYTPLHLAARGGRAAAVKALLKAGANAKAITTAGGTTPLHFAAGIGSTEAVTALLDAGAEVDARETAWGQTPLMWAANYDRVDAVKLLLARGADIKAISKVESVPERERVQGQDRSLRNRRVQALAQAENPQAGRGAAPPAGGGRGAGAPATPAGRAGAPAATATAGATAMPDSTARRATPAPNATAPASDSASRARPAADSASSPDQGGQRGYPAPAAGAPQEAAAAAPGGGRAGGRGGRGGGAAERALSYGELVGNKGGLTPLLFAAREGNMETVKTLLAAGAPIGQESAGDHTSPMLMAAINGHFDIAKLLLERGASPNQMSDAGATPLYATINVQYAAKSLYPQPTAQKQQKTTYLEFMEQLLKMGANPNARLSKHLWYMSYNFDLLSVNTTGATPFWRAAYGTDVPAMRLLLKYGADPTIATRRPAGGRQRGDDAPAEDEGDVKDPSGLPPIPAGGPGVYPIHAASGVGYGEGYAANAHMHAPDGWIPSVKFLIEELGVDVNSRDHNGYTPLHHAAARGDNEMIMYLMSKGADITVVSRRGQTVADMANGPVQRIPPFVETVKLLEKLGSKNSNKCRSC